MFIYEQLCGAHDFSPQRAQSTQRILLNTKLFDTPELIYPVMFRQPRHHHHRRNKRRSASEQERSAYSDLIPEEPRYYVDARARSPVAV